MNIKCVLTGHDDQTETLSYDKPKFIVIGQCQRCNEQWWMKGETGELKGIRFVQNDKGIRFVQTDYYEDDPLDFPWGDK